MRALFVPHSWMVRVVADMSHDKVLADLGEYLEFLAAKSADNTEDSPWHRPVKLGKAKRGRGESTKEFNKK